jgi:hypothetical protein
LQTYTLLYTLKDGRDNALQAALSILMSAFTAGFTAAVMTFDYDVSPERRRNEPDFYGCIPDSAARRTLAFVCMIANGTILLVVRSASTALLAFLGSHFVVGYYVADMGLYFVYKILRRDFWHWVPLEGWVGVFVSVTARGFIKAFVDFTGIIQFR